MGRLFNITNDIRAGKGSFCILCELMLTMTVKETSLVRNISGHPFRIRNQVESLHFFIGKGDSNCSEGLRFDLYFSCDISSFWSPFLFIFLFKCALELAGL